MSKRFDLHLFIFINIILYLLLLLYLIIKIIKKGALHLRF